MADPSQVLNGVRDVALNDVNPKSVARPSQETRPADSDLVHRRVILDYPLDLFLRSYTHDRSDALPVDLLHHQSVAGRDTDGEKRLRSRCAASTSRHSF